MKSLTPIASPETTVLKACRDAVDAQHDCAVKCLIAGHLLMEYRDALAMSCHGGKSSTNEWHNKNKPHADKFCVWLESHDIASRTAYRWMEAAERVARTRLGIPMHRSFSNFIEIEGAAPLALSHCLTADAASLPAKALKFRQDAFDFMADRTLGEAARAAFEGESEGKRITLAASGKAKGGACGENRKDFPLFISKNLLALNGNLKGWEKWQKKEPAQYAEVVALMRSFILGGQVRSHHNGAKATVQGWPRSLRELVADLIKESFRTERDAR